jgi:hypothetical protein
LSIPPHNKLIELAYATSAMKPKTAYIVGSTFLVALGTSITLFFGLRIVSQYESAQLSNYLFNQNPLRSTASVLSFALNVLCSGVGLLLVLRTLQIATIDLPRGAIARSKQSSESDNSGYNAKQ